MPIKKSEFQEDVEQGYKVIPAQIIIQTDGIKIYAKIKGKTTCMGMIEPYELRSVSNHEDAMSLFDDQYALVDRLKRADTVKYPIRD